MDFMFLNFEPNADPTYSVVPYFILSLLTLFEGPLATLLSGAATSSGFLLPIPAFLSVVIGNLTADSGWYLLGRLGKMEKLLQICSSLHIDNHRIDQLRLVVQSHAPRLIFLAKLTVGFPIPTILALGLNRIPVRRWFFFLLLGEFIKSAVLLSVGYLYAQTLQQASYTIQIVLWVITLLVVLTGVIWYKAKIKKR